jgi:hypothetical protein
MALIELTRVYKNKTSNEIKTQPITVNSDAIETIKPSNRLGYPEHRATIILVSGTVLELADKYSEVNALLKASY